jgi:hypothetical protein
MSINSITRSLIEREKASPHKAILISIIQNIIFKSRSISHQIHELLRAFQYLNVACKPISKDTRNIRGKISRITRFVKNFNGESRLPKWLFVLSNITKNFNDKPPHNTYCGWSHIRRIFPQRSAAETTFENFNRI